MPTVPRIEPGQVREEITPRVQDTTRPSSAAFGGGQQQVFQSAGRLAQASGELFDRTRTRIVDAQVKEGDARFGELQTLVEQQVGQMKLKNAADSVTFADDEFQKGVEGILKDIDDDAVKARLQGAAELRKSKLRERAIKHTFSEAEKYEDQTQSAFVNNARNEAIQNYREPGAIQESLIMQLNSIESYAQNKGWSAEQTKEAMTTAQSKTHLGILQRMVNAGDDQLASDYISKVKKSLAADDLVTAEKLVDSGNLRGESQRRADDIFGKNSESQTLALEEARSIDDPKLRDETVRRVKQRFSDKKKAKDQDNESLHQRAANTIDGGGGVDAIPREDWERFSASQKTALINYANKRSEGIEPETDWVKYYDLKTKASVPATRGEFLKTNLMELRPKMADREFKEMVKLQADLRSGKKSKELDGFRSDNQIVNDAMRAAGFNTNPSPGSDEAKSLSQLRARVDEEIRQRQERTGKKATNEDIQSVVDTMLVEVVTDPGLFFDTRKRVFELDPEETGQIEIDDVPRNDRNKIEQALKKNGVPVTEDAILNLYRQRLETVTRSGF